MSGLRCVYVDLDGTLLGRGASLLHDGDGQFTLLGVRALEACWRAGVEVALYSGRRRAQLFDDARLLGVASYAFEAGAGLVVDGETHWLTRTLHGDIADSGAPALLLGHYEGRLEYHAPWHADREVSHLMRGAVDAAEATALLAGRGLEHLHLIDNGAIHRSMPGIERPHAYHLVPREVSKARAVALHMQIRGYGREQTLAVGDSREDAGVAAAVGAFWLVRNAVERDPSLAALPGVHVCSERHGAGVYEAVVQTLAER